MQILPAALERIRTSEFNAEHIVRILQALETVLQQNPAPAAEIKLHFLTDEDQVTAEDLIPVITFSLQSTIGE